MRLEAKMEVQSKLTDAVQFGNIVERLSKLTKNIGIETYSFKVGWYNDAVKTNFHLPWNPDTLAFLVLSIPEMFEKCLIPFIKGDSYECFSRQDPLDQCMKGVFKTIKKEFSEFKVEGIHDYEMHPNRRPKILLQTAGHISGAAYYYRQEDLKTSQVGNKLYGVSIHPKYGGWFAFRGVLIFEDVLCPSLERKNPTDILVTEELKYEALKRFNNNWKDWTYRDIIKTEARYSDEQKQFFITPPAERRELIQNFIKAI